MLNTLCAECFCALRKATQRSSYFSLALGDVFGRKSASCAFVFRSCTLLLLNPGSIPAIPTILVLHLRASPKGLPIGLPTQSKLSMLRASASNVVPWGCLSPKNQSLFTVSQGCSEHIALRTCALFRQRTRPCRPQQVSVAQGLGLKFRGQCFCGATEA